MYQHLSAKSGRQVWPRAGIFLDLPGRRTGTVLHFVSIAGSNNEWTHRVSFGTQDKKLLAKMYSGILNQSKDFALFGNTMDRTTEGKGSYLGKSLIGEPLQNSNFLSERKMFLKCRIYGFVWNLYFTELNL